MKFEWDKEKEEVLLNKEEIKILENKSEKIKKLLQYG